MLLINSNGANGVLFKYHLPIPQRSYQIILK